MLAAICAVILAGPWVNDPAFPQAKQEKALEATLRLKNPSNNGEATAVRIGRQGRYVYYLTAKHNVEGTKVVDLESYSAKSHPNTVQKIAVADVEYLWNEHDVALLKATEVDHLGFAYICPENARPTKSDFPALTIGCTGGNPPEILVDGVKNRLKVTNKVTGNSGWNWQIAVPPKGGRSGGPMFDANGYLIGICSGVSEKDGYFVDVEELRAYLKYEYPLLLRGPPAK